MYYFEFAKRCPYENSDTIKYKKRKLHINLSFILFYILYHSASRD